MKKFLILLALSAFLAIPAISLADGAVTGGGVVSSLTVKANSVNDNVSPSVMKNESYVLKSGTLVFSVMSGVYPKSQGQAFNATVTFPVSAMSSGKDSSLSNMSITMNGFVINADNTKSAALGEGSLEGTVTHTDSNGNPQNVDFTGSYNMKVALSGWVSQNGNSNPTKGTAAFIFTIAGMENADSGTPIPIVISLNMPTTAFQLSQTGPVTTDWTLNYTMTKGPDYDPNNPQSGTVDLVINQIGTAFTGTMTDGSGYVNNVSGTISGNNFSMKFSDTNQNNVPETVTITGTVTSGTFGTSGATMSGTFSSTTGDSGKWDAKEK